MSVDREYRIKISTVADVSGVKQTAAELDGLSPKTQKYIESLKDSGSAAEHAEMSHRGLVFALRGLGPEAMEAGHALLYGLTNPMLLGIIGIGMASAKLLGDWRAMREAIEAAVDVSGMDKVTQALGRDGMLNALIEGGVAAEDFWGKINALAGAQESLKVKTDDATKAIKEQTEADEKVLAAKEKAQLAELKLGLANGTIPQGDYEQRKGEIESRFEGQRTNRQAIDQDRLIEARRHEREVAGRVIAEGPDVVTSKQIAADAAKGNLEGQKAGLEEWKKKLEEINKWFTEKSGAADAATFTEQDKARKLALREIAEREQGTVPAAKVSAKQTAAELATAQKSVEEATKRKGELDREITKLEADRTRDRATAAAVSAAGVSGPFGMAATGDVSGASQTALQYDKFRQRKGAEPSQGQEQALIDVATRISGHKVSLAQAVAIMEPAATNIQAFTDDAMKLATVMGNIARFLGKYQTSQGQLDSIAAQVKALEDNPTTRTIPGG